MRIALVTEHLDHRRGGEQRYTHDFAAWLAGQGHDVVVLTRDAHEPPPGAQVTLVETSGLTQRARTLSFARRVRERLQRLQADVSMATGKALGQRVYQPHGGTVLGSQRQNLLRVRGETARRLKACWNRVSPGHRALRRLDARQFADPMTHFVAVSDMVRRDMRSFYGIAEHRITLIYNGIDVERFHPDHIRTSRADVRRQLLIADTATVFLLVAHNFALKGLGETIEALACLRNGAAPDVHLVVVGRGKSRRYRKLARRLGVDSRVHFAGAASDIAPYYGAADAYVHPTWYDPCSLVVLEALASGLPVLTTRCNGASELMDGRGAGVVLDVPRPVSRLIDGMGELLDPARRESMAREARRVAEEHAQERNFREMLDVLTRAAPGQEAVT